MKGENTYSRSKSAMSNKAKRYVINWNGKTFRGSPEDVARWYCKQRSIKLYVEPNPINEQCFILLAAFLEGRRMDYVDGKLQPVSHLTDIGLFENCDYDVESAYRLFFREYMLEEDDCDYELGVAS